MMINTVMEMKKYIQGGVECQRLYMPIAYILLQKQEIVLCICLLLCDAGQKYD